MMVMVSPTILIMMMMEMEYQMLMKVHNIFVRLLTCVLSSLYEGVSVGRMVNCMIACMKSLTVLNVLNMLSVLSMPKEASLPCWPFFSYHLLSPCNHVVGSVSLLFWLS